jgi:hypothetical protein
VGKEDPRSLLWANLSHHDVATTAEHELYGIFADGDNCCEGSLRPKSRDGNNERCEGTEERKEKASV